MISNFRIFTNAGVPVAYFSVNMATLGENFADDDALYTYLASVHFAQVCEDLGLDPYEHNFSIL